MKRVYTIPFHGQPNLDASFPKNTSDEPLNDVLSLVGLTNLGSLI
jgi:hypothetical protein